MIFSNTYFSTRDIEVFVNRGLEKLKEEKTTTTHICVLEKLYEIDKNIAIIMVFDSLLAGVDTVSSILK